MAGVERTNGGCHEMAKKTTLHIVLEQSLQQKHNDNKFKLPHVLLLPLLLLLLPLLLLLLQFIQLRYSLWLLLRMVSYMHLRRLPFECTSEICETVA